MKKIIKKRLIKLSFLSDKLWKEQMHSYCNIKKFNAKTKFANLVDVKNILCEFNLDYWLIGGTLLGFYRSGKFIKWDWDIDIDVCETDLLPIYDEVRNRFIDCGFISRGSSGHQKTKLNLIRNGERTTVRGLFFEDSIEPSSKYILSAVDRYPKRFFNSSVYETIKFKDVEFRVPSPVLKYIEYLYGKKWKKTEHSRKKLRADYIKRGVMRKDYAKSRGWL